MPGHEWGISNNIVLIYEALSSNIGPSVSLMDCHVIGTQLLLLENMLISAFVILWIFTVGKPSCFGVWR